MRWPYDNNTANIVRRLARRTDGADRKSRLLLIGTVALAVAMVLAVALVSAGLAETAKDAYRDKAQVTVIGPTEDQLVQMRASDAISWVGEYAALGYSYQGEMEVFVCYADADYLSKEAGLSYEGALPEAADEVMASAGALRALGQPAEIGATVHLDLTGLGETRAYRLTALSAAEKDAHTAMIYVSRPLAQQIADATMDGHWQITAYPRIVTDDISADGLINAAEAATKDAGIQREQIFLTDYFAAMNGVLGGGLHISIPMVALAAALLGGFIIYSLFYTMVTREVQTLGQLRTIGMTKRQLRRMMARRARAVAGRGVALGLLAGTFLGWALCPGGFRLPTALIYGVLAVVAAWCAVRLALFWPTRLALRISPIEGSRYQGKQGQVPARKVKAGVHHPLTPARLARLYLGRQRAKTFFTIAALSVSGALLLASGMVAGSMDAEKQARFEYYPDGDIQISLQNVARSTFDANGVYNYSTQMQLENNPLDDADFVEALRATDGVRKVTAHDAVYTCLTVPDGAAVLGRADYTPTLSREDYAAIQDAIVGNAPDYEAFTEEQGILMDAAEAEVGDVYPLELRGRDGEKTVIDAPVLAVYDNEVLMRHHAIVPGHPAWMLTHDMAAALTGVTQQTGVLSLDVEAAQFDAVWQRIDRLAAESDRWDATSITQTVANIEEIDAVTIRNLRMIAALLFIFGALSLANALLIDFQNRLPEFALLKAVGAGDRQLCAMLRREIALVVGGAVLLAFLAGGAGGVLACARIDAIHHNISLALPWTLAGGLLLVMAFIGVLAYLFMRRSLKNVRPLSHLDAQ